MSMRRTWRSDGNWTRRAAAKTAAATSGGVVARIARSRWALGASILVGGQQPAGEQNPTSDADGYSDEGEGEVLGSDQARQHARAHTGSAQGAEFAESFPDIGRHRVEQQCGGHAADGFADTTTSGDGSASHCPGWARKVLPARERTFSYAVARAFAGHRGKSSGTTDTYVKSHLHEVAAALAVLTGEPHPLARGVGHPAATPTRDLRLTEFNLPTA